ncbi:GSU2403 family nucleotidyltransferase fold protein [Pararhizobium sp.]|uniref:GSU2403 family nucleotidyltransferase fold protein n=1 Tax=Pararhizobium sp. TaxID=1977563 RepID=UPI003D0D772D
MAFKTVGKHQYLYRKARKAWKSLGPRNGETEKTFEAFHAGRQTLRDTVASLASRLNELAAINRAMGLGRVPLIAARILRAVDSANLMGSALDIAGTHCLFAYERMAGVHIDSQLIATGDIDLLLDRRTSLRLLATHVPPDGWIDLLKSVDQSFRLLSKGSYRAVNKDGFFVDLITPQSADPIKPVGTDLIQGTDLTPVEIDGLKWLVNSPKIEVTVLDGRGFPLMMSVPDPRSFALHKIWVSEREDRDPLKQGRDRDQAFLVAELIATHLPHLSFEDPALNALPLELRRRAAMLTNGTNRNTPLALEPDW